MQATDQQQQKQRPWGGRRGTGVALALAALVAVAGLAGWWAWPLRRAEARVEEPEPPLLEAGGADPAVVRLLEDLRAAVCAAPRSAAAWGELGKALFVHDDLARACVCFARAGQLDPREPRWPYFLGLALTARDPEAAIGHLRRSVELCGSEPDGPCLRLAELLLAQARPQEAQDAFARVLRADPENARAHLGLARLAFQRGELRDSLWHLGACGADRRTRQAAARLLAQVHQKLRDSRASEQALRRADEYPPDQAWPDPYREEALSLQTGLKAALIQGERLMRQRREAEAIALLRRTAQDYPRSEWAWLLLGKALLRSRDLPAAEQILRKALELEPDSLEALFRLGVALALQDRYGEAAGYYRQALRRKDDFTMAHYNLGLCLARQGDRSGAVAAFRNAVRTRPRFAAAHRQLGDLLAQTGQHGEADRHLREALQLDPADDQARALRARLVREKGTPPSRQE